jgi:hypothetical protein
VDHRLPQVFGGGDVTGRALADVVGRPVVINGARMLDGGPDDYQ